MYLSLLKKMRPKSAQNNIIGYIEKFEFKFDYHQFFFSFIPCVIYFLIDWIPNLSKKLHYI